MELERFQPEISYRQIKYPRLELRTGKLCLILPHGQDPGPLLEKHQNWIRKKTGFIEKCLRESDAKELNYRTENDFRRLAASLTYKAAKKLKVEVNHIYFRKMKTKWASCSPKGNLTLNSILRFLPDRLIEYVIFHETAHLIEKRHNEKFWGIISKEFKNYQNLEGDLYKYWFRICRGKKNLESGL